MLSAQDRNLHVIRLTCGKYRLVEGCGATSNQLMESLGLWEAILKERS